MEALIYKKRFTSNQGNRENTENGRQEARRFYLDLRFKLKYISYKEYEYLDWWN